MLAAGQADQALEILHRLEQAIDAEGAVRPLMGVRITQALIYQQKGDQARARHAFESTLRLALVEGYRSQFFMRPGRPTGPLLEMARSIAPAFVDGILKRESVEPALPFADLPEPLSGQEIRVLKLIVAGKSNAEIADELFISVGTAKWHVHNILQKLGVSNRPQAIARARELELEA